MGYSRKKSKQGGLRIYFFENPPGVLHFFTVLYQTGNSRQNEAQQLNPCEISGTLEIPGPKTKTPPGNSTLFFLGHPWKFHFLFN